MNGFRMRTAGAAFALGLASMMLAASQPARAADAAASGASSAPAAASASGASGTSSTRRSVPHGKLRRPAPASKATADAVADYNAGDYASALAGFGRSARRGDRLAQFDYAMMLLKGEGGPANQADGLHCLNQAADAGMTQAQYVLGTMYDDGQFVARDPAVAHGWFLKAAQQGHMEAQLALANQFLDGRGTPRDNHQAFEWYRKAADAGEPTAQYVTASFYERGGDGVAVDLNLARVYYAAAAVHGDEVAALKYQEVSTALRKQVAAASAASAASAGAVPAAEAPQAASQ
ncbi:tetratricopeptide repeat protein [Burkholderia gladioli]|uniref:tetratricopeptide repeat protein n=1 Tax=Burkholderia gladioli TaxID=28095 RepID=UPI0016401794|nr:tetratricopeptide repeat protein [Burkholderia gladioli]